MTSQPRARATEDVEVSQFIQAQPETIFRFFTDRERFSRWLSAPVEFEARPKSPLRIQFASCQTVVAGEIIEIVPNQKLVISWGVAEGAQARSMPTGSTRVTITLTPKADGTLVTLRHTGIPTTDECKGHREGWTQYLAQLDQQVVGEHDFAVATALVREYIAAWNEDDSARCASHLDRCFATEGRFLDRYAAVASRAALAQHIAMSRQMFPGVTLAPTTPPQVCHGHVCFGWQFKDANGHVLAAGRNYAEVERERFSKVVGFYD
ncbi:MAG: SRPBCC domain-containing protein [Planctomycetota bacterium]